MDQGISITQRSNPTFIASNYISNISLLSSLKAYGGKFESIEQSLKTFVHSLCMLLVSQRGQPDPRQFCRTACRSVGAMQQSGDDGGVSKETSRKIYPGNGGKKRHSSIDCVLPIVRRFRSSFQVIDQANALPESLQNGTGKL